MTHENYFDINGSTPVHPRVVEACCDHMSRCYGNAGAVHPEGRLARVAIDKARNTISRAIGAEQHEIRFTSGGTEANNWALFGVARKAGRGHLVVSSVEHKSVLRAAQQLQEEGFEVSHLPVDEHCRVDTSKLAEVCRPDTIMVSVMLANNETGVLQPAAEIGAWCREQGILFHCDAVAAVGKLEIDVNELNCDMLSVSSHKFYAPKGCGLLYIRDGIALAPMIHGCGQQDGMRSGTENTTGVVAMARAFELMGQGILKSEEQLRALTERLWRGIQAAFPDAVRNGNGSTLANTLNVYFPETPGAKMQTALGEMGFSVAAGAAATNGAPSHVLKAMGASDERARCSLRFTLGSYTTGQSVDALLGALRRARAQVRAPLSKIA